MGIEVKIPEFIFLKAFAPAIREVVLYKELETASPSPFTDTVYLIGYSAKIEPLLAWAREKKGRALVIIEKRFSVLLDIEEEGLTEPFLEENIHFRFYREEIPLEDFAFALVREFFGKIEIFNLQEDPLFFEEIRRTLLRKGALTDAIYTEMLRYHQLFANLIANFRKLPEAFALDGWQGSFKNTLCVICGAGPSLSEARELLKREDDLLIFAGGSTISALNAIHITPHLLFAVDPNPEEFSRLAFHTSQGVPLVIAPRVEPRVTSGHIGPIGFFPTGTGGAIEAFFLERLGIKDPKILEHLGEEALSVTCIALMTAIYLGCNPIIFAGVDLSFTDGRRYASGVFAEDVIQEPLLEEEGKKTLIRWIMERDTIEEVIKNHPDTTFYLATEGGLTFKGAGRLPADSPLVQNPRDLRGEIYDKVFASPLSVTKEAVEGVLLELQESFLLAKEILGKMLLALEKEDTMASTLLFMDLEETLAFRVALKTSLFALEQRLSCKKEVYKQLKEIGEAFLSCF
ncbi:MAG: DUF115 domain-containing protein [Verrucomicrobia bacterium]|nr:DUF115 domain-containing protein [Verrucomicrobiota bacterium]